MRIKQGKRYVNKFDFLGKYNLRQYDDPNESAIFFGCYRTSHVFKSIIRHKSLGIIVWLGSDIQMLEPYKLKAIKNKKNIKHVAISEFIAKDLRRLGINNFKKLPLNPSKIIANPQSLGNRIYCYAPKTSYHQYGGKILDILKKTFPYIIVASSPSQYTKEQLIEVYKKCFIGLRLTSHDGLPNTVIELGLMGRRCIYNGILPNSIAWNGIPDIIKTIKTEQLKIGQTNNQLVDAMVNFLNIDDSWLNENYWK